MSKAPEDQMSGLRVFFIEFDLKKEKEPGNEALFQENLRKGI